MMNAIISTELTLQETIALFDRDFNSDVDIMECHDVIRQLLPCLTSRQVHGILKAMGMSLGGHGGDQSVSIARFLTMLCMDFTAPPDPKEPWILPSLGLLARQLAPDVAPGDRLATGEVLLKKFSEWDTDGNGLLDRHELHDALL